MISWQQDISLQGSSHRWEFSHVPLREKDSFLFKNFKYSLSRVPSYVRCIESCGPRWLGLKFMFPLIWWPDKNYKGTYKMTKKAKRDCLGALIMTNGFLQPGRCQNIHLTSKISIGRILSLLQTQTSSNCCMRTCNRIAGGRCWVLNLPLFTLLCFTLSPYFCPYFASESLSFSYKQA